MKKLEDAPNATRKIKKHISQLQIQLGKDSDDEQNKNEQNEQNEQKEQKEQAQA